MRRLKRTITPELIVEAVLGNAPLPPPLAISEAATEHLTNEIRAASEAFRPAWQPETAGDDVAEAQQRMARYRELRAAPVTSLSQRERDFLAMYPDSAEYHALIKTGDAAA